MSNYIKQWLSLRDKEREISAALEEALRGVSHGISVNEFYALYFLHKSESEELRMSDLSQKIGLSLSATSRLLSRFETNCHVIECIACADDKRGVEVRLTQVGQDVLEEALKKVNEVLANYEADLL